MLCVTDLTCKGEYLGLCMSSNSQVLFSGFLDLYGTGAVGLEKELVSAGHSPRIISRCPFKTKLGNHTWVYSSLRFASMHKDFGLVNLEKTFK